MARHEYRVLGPVDVLIDGKSVKVRGPRQRIALALLLLSANQVVPFDRLVDALWDGNPPATARNQVHTCVSTLRKELHQAGIIDVIQTYAAGYRLVVQEGQLDLATFRDLVHRGRDFRNEGRTAEAAGCLRTALSCWRGGALTGVESRLIQSVAQGLEEERMAALGFNIELDLKLGRHSEMVSELNQLVASYPLQEHLRGLHMRALYRSGRQAEALESYQILRRLLQEELGLEPSKALRDLEYRILAGQEEAGAPVPERAAAEAAEAAGPVPVPVPRELPAAIADFTGHDAEVSQMAALLSEARTSVPIVSIYGIGGAGKSTLAVQVAHRASDQYPDGQVFATLRAGDGQPVSTMRLLERFLRILSGPGCVIPESLEERTTAYRSLLGGRKILIVLDDAESVEQVLPLIPGNPDCALVITSRRSLVGLDGCREWGLGPLDQKSCVDLLSQILGPARVQAELAEAIELSRLCAYLPLAIRIVAARLASRPYWTTAQMVMRLSTEQSRLDEIAVGTLNIRACISVSYIHLKPGQRTLLMRLAALGLKDFPSWICAPLLAADVPVAEEILAELVEERLVEALRVSSGAVRFRVHDLVRLYCMERFPAEDDQQAWRQALERTLGCWLALAEEAHRRTYAGDFFVLHGQAGRWPLPAAMVDQMLADPLKWLQSEHDALVGAVFHARQALLDEVCWDLAVTLVTLFESEHLVDDWRGTHDAALEVTRECGNVRGEAVIRYSLGVLESLQGTGRAHEYLTAARIMFFGLNDLHGAALAVQGEGFADRQKGDFRLALRHSREALEIFSQIDDPVGEVSALNNMAQTYLELEETEKAIRLLHGALVKCKALGVPRIRAQTEYRLGEALVSASQFETAATCFGSVVELSQGGHDRLGEAYGLYGLGVVSAKKYSFRASRDFLKSAYEIAEQLNSSLLLKCIVRTLEESAWVIGAADQPLVILAGIGLESQSAARAIRR